MTHVGQAQFARDVIDEAQLLVHRIDQRELALRIDDGQRQAREPGAGAHVGNLRAGQFRLRAQGIQQVMREDQRRDR